MKKVLMIEDDMNLQKLYTEALKGIDDVQFSAAPTGKEGIEKCKKEVPDLIILDIMLPGGMNGFDVAEELKRDPHMSKIPILVLTNLDSERKVAMDMGAVDYMIKANTAMSDVRTKVKTLLGY